MKKRFTKSLLKVRKNKEGKIVGFTINRKYWDYSRAKVESKGQLLTEEGTMCCLGFLGRCLGLSEQNILGSSFVTEHFDTDGLKDKIPNELMFRTLEGLLTEINDIRVGATIESIRLDSYKNKITSRASKEKLIAEAFSKAGITVKFEG